MSEECHYCLKFPCACPAWMSAMGEADAVAERHIVVESIGFGGWEEMNKTFLSQMFQASRDAVCREIERLSPIADALRGAKEAGRKGRKTCPYCNGSGLSEGK